MEYSNVIMDDAHPISFLIGKQLDSSVPGGLVGDPNTAAVTSREISPKQKAPSRGSEE